ncbi:hypothetical protein [Streptomyces sp. bgisy031]|uniref:hypothetical protein n=1 Tax=Streptomyces sp. bgisy031 TaxID=3413772 RepID=UPI003D728C11
MGDDNLLLARASAARQGVMTVVAGSGADNHAEFAGPVEPLETQVDRDRSRAAVQSWYAAVPAVAACPAGTRSPIASTESVPAIGDSPPGSQRSGVGSAGNALCGRCWM